MTLTPILDAPLVLQIHVALAALIIALTVFMFSLPKGSPVHRRLGWLWVLTMAGIALSSFGIHTIRWIGPFSPIHLLSVLVLYALFYGVTAARTKRVMAHQLTMKSIVLYALIVTGALTFIPGRLMFEMVSGG